MRWLVRLVFIGLIGWSGYWFIGAKGQEQVFAQWLETNRSNGWIADSATMNVTGFPNRFDTIIEQLDLQGPNGDWGWQAEGFQVYALSYQPNHIILAWPGKQVISNRHGSLTLQGTEFRGSIVVAPNTDLTLERLRVEATDLSAISSLGWSSYAKSANMALFQDTEIPSRYRLGLDFEDVTFPSEFMAALVQLGQNTDVISQIMASAYISFEREIDRSSINSGLPNWNALELESLQINWGRANLSMTGQLTPAANGYIDGNIDFTVENWRMLFEALRQTATLRPSELALIEGALSGLSQGGRLEFSLRFDNGKAYIGPFVVGAAPINPVY